MTSEIRTDCVSVIVPFYNRARYLEEAVQSVLAQTWSSFELILCNDGSTDDSVNVAERLSKEHPDMIRIVHIPHSGPGAAREAGRLLARGEFIQYLDSDDRLLSNKFARQIQALREDSAADIAYGITRLIEADGSVVKEPYKWTGEAREHLFPGLLVDRWWCTHTPLYRRRLCDRIGPWSDLRYSQDWEYDARAGAMRTRLTFIPEVVSEHRQHPGLRQTGRGTWLQPVDQVRFFGSLLAAARQAGVGFDSSEMRHFARWVFSCARRAAIIGDSDAAHALLSLATEASDPVMPDLAAYRMATRCFGQQLTAKGFEAVTRLRGRDKGPASLQQAWMEDEYL